MTSLESHFVPKQYSDQQPSTDHSLRPVASGAELNLAQRESPWLDEVDLDELYHEDGLSVSTDKLSLADIDAV